MATGTANGRLARVWGAFWREKAIAWTAIIALVTGVGATVWTLEAAVGRLANVWGADVEILTEDTRERLCAERARLVAICGDRRTDFPSVKRRAAVAEDEGQIEGMRGWYALPYRANSQAAVHPMIWAIEMMMESHPETGGVVIHPEVAPGRAQVDVYRTGAHLLGVLLLIIANENDDQALHDRIVAILERLPPRRDI